MAIRVTLDSMVARVARRYFIAPVVPLCSVGRSIGTRGNGCWRGGGPTARNGIDVRVTRGDDPALSFRRLGLPLKRRGATLSALSSALSEELHGILGRTETAFRTDS